MPFNVNEFKSQMNRFGGPAQTSLFQIQIVGAPFLFGTNARERDLTFFCQAATIPGMQTQTAEYSAVGARPKTFVTGMNSEPMSAVFMLDSDHQIQRFLHGWMQKVVNYSQAGGNLSEVNGMLPYEVGFKDEYACRLIIRHYSTFNNSGGKYYEVILDNAFPINVSPTDLSWQNSNTPAIMAVSFAYDKIYYDGEQVGFPTSRLSRGSGLLDLLTTVGVISQLVNTNFKPQGIQDAINKLNRFNNAVNTLGL
jgi:hypothetical protein